MSPFLADVPFFNVLQHFSQKKQLKNHPKIKLFEPKYLSFSGLNFDSHFWWKNDHFGEPFWHPGPPRDPFFGQNGVTPLRGSSFFQKCVRWSPSGRPKWPQGSPKDPPRPPQGHFLATFGPLWVTFWWILTTFGRLFGHFCSRLEMFLEFHWFP